MEPTRDSGSPPLQVKAALVLWALGALLNMVTWSFQVNWHDWIMYPTAAVVLMLSLFLLWLLYRRHNWARWLVVGLVSFRILMALGAIHRANEVSWYQLGSVGSRLGCQLAAAILLFRSGATSWFRGGHHAG